MREPFISRDEFELSFVSPDQLELKSMEWKVTRYRRAEPYARTGAEDLSPVDRDTFQRGGMTVRFHRDDTGKVVTFEFSNPVNRNIAVTRISEPPAARQ